MQSKYKVGYLGVSSYILDFLRQHARSQNGTTPILHCKSLCNIFEHYLVKSYNSLPLSLSPHTGHKFQLLNTNLACTFLRSINSY